MSARDHAMARIAVVHLLCDTIGDQVAGLLAEFADPEKKGIEIRIKGIDDMMADCHGMAIALQQAREATEAMTANEVLMTEDDLVPEDDEPADNE